MADERRRSLGRGLSALLGDTAVSEEGAAAAKAAAGAGADRPFKTVPVEFLKPGRYQPRHAMDPDQLQDLAQSIREKGIIQPILVRRHPDEPGAYEIIAGERRWRAAQQAALHEVPIIIKDLDDKDTLEIALVENLQRADLSPLDEAQGYRRLMDEFAHTQEILAKVLGKSRSHVANTLRLLNLPEAVTAMLAKGELTAGHARALLGATDPVGLARKVVKRGLNVRQTEALAKGGGKAGKKTIPVKDADTIALERDLGNLLGLKAVIRFKGDSGTLTLHYKTLEQLDDLIERLSQRPPGKGDRADD